MERAFEILRVRRGRKRHGVRLTVARRNRCIRFAARERYLVFGVVELDAEIVFAEFVLNCAGEVARKVDGQVILAGRALRGVARVFPIERIRSCDLAIFAIARELDSRIGRARFE